VTLREVIVARPFWQAFDAQADYFESVRHLYPDAGNRLERLANDLIDRVIPLLEHSADIGRPYSLNSTDSGVSDFEVSAAVAGLSGAKAILREYVDTQFNILYAVTPTQVFLINLRNQKQAGY
jgi:hypothetical protein